MACVFCNIVERTAPALIIHEDDRTLSFLPLEPAVSGHTLVVPKEHHADLYSMRNSVTERRYGGAESRAARTRGLSPCVHSSRDR
jgi:diadenosine tetraphosphate (Ap4A) HIT family hydrolase